MNLFLENVKTIKFFSSKKNKIILEVENNYYNFKVEEKNNINESYKADLNFNYITLKNDIINARRENLNKKENFYLNVKKEYSFEAQQKDLYINIDEENIIIEKLANTDEEIEKGKKYIYNNYIIKNLNYNYKKYENFYIKKEEYKDLTMYQKNSFKTLDENIKRLELMKNTYKKNNYEKFKEFYTQKLNENYYGSYFDYKTENKDVFFVKNFDRIEKSESYLLYEKNINFIQKKYSFSSVYNIKKLLMDLKFDLYNIDIEKLINEK